MNELGKILVTVITPEQAKIIYKNKYWDPIKGDQIKDQQVADLYMDTQVNGGGASVMQKALEKMGVKGVTNKNLIEKINSVNGEDLFNTYKSERLNRFDRLIEKNPKLKVFKGGWNNRVNDFKYKK